MASGLFATESFLLLLLALCEARPMSLQKFHHATILIEEAWELMAGTSCTEWDIKINQGEESGVGLPTWAVQITKACIDPWCSISNVIVQCGQFHSASIVNRAVFRSLDSTSGNCILKNGNVIGNGEIVAFRYQEKFKEPLTLKSAQLSCLG